MSLLSNEDATTLTFPYKLLDSSGTTSETISAADIRGYGKGRELLEYLAVLRWAGKTGHPRM